MSYDLDQWLTSTETEQLEFKEDITDKSKIFRYCAALANEGGGKLVLGVTDKTPRQVCGTRSFQKIGELNKLKLSVIDKLKIRVDIQELSYSGKRVLVFDVPNRFKGRPVECDGAYWMRSGESLVPMTQDVLKRIFDEGENDWLLEHALTNLSGTEVISLLDTQGYFELLKEPYPPAQEEVLEKLRMKGLIQFSEEGWNITNLAALTLAKKLDSFGDIIAKRAPRVIIYDGTNKLKTRTEQTGTKGYAVAFDGLIDFVHSSAPRNVYIEEAIRQETKMFPKQALRELIANALVHQDFAAVGNDITIEMYDDRVEVSNPGTPTIDPNRFVDEDFARNEKLADIMRRLGVCEKKGSGIDKVVDAAEVFQLPAPDFRVRQLRTTAILFAHKNFEDMTKSERVRACFQHCCLQYVSNRQMSNQSLRDRFRLPESKTAIASKIIAETKKAGLIVLDDTETQSTRYARYVPYFALKSV